MSVYLGLGERITTNSSDCRQWISRGVLNSFGFRREEAIRCFRKAISFDRNCPIAYFFIAYNNAADYNNPGGIDYAEGYKESQKALEMAKSTPSIPDWEMALIEAQTHRFCWPVGFKEITDLHRDYNNAMRPVYEKYGGNDPDIAALYAESVMLLAPWTLWTKPPEIKPAIKETEEVVAILEKGLELDPTNPGLCHFYIHAMELSATPEKALPAADVLRSQYPNQGHLVHMPSHIDMWVGQYKEAVEVNKKAIITDEQYMLEREPKIELYDMYRMHNYHFVVWASMFDGQFATAMKYAEIAEDQLTVEVVSCKLYDAPFGSMWLEGFATLPWHVLIRFGKWQEILDRPIKEDKSAYPATVATAHYARAIAFAILGKLNEADAERENFYTSRNNQRLEKCFLLNNPMTSPMNNGILDIAEAVMNGEVEYHNGNFDKSFEWLHKAVERDTSLVYDEPWGWMIPTRHTLGALLLEQKELAEAESVYREDLKQYKDNLWSLLGLHQALKEQGKKEEAQDVLVLFKKASVRCDVSIGASCLCARKLCSD